MSVLQEAYGELEHQYDTACSALAEALQRLEELQNSSLQMYDGPAAAAGATAAASARALHAVDTLIQVGNRDVGMW